MHSLGPILNGIAPTIADTNHSETMLWGCEMRYLAKPPPIERSLWQELYNFVARELAARYVPLELDDIPTSREWLENSGYSNPRKQELIAVETESLGSDPCAGDSVELAGFGKRETYLKYKPPRGINSRSDKFKLWAGPLMAAIERKVYEDPSFIKHVPVKDRPLYIRERLGDNPGPFYVSDFSHFESFFTPEIQQAMEGQLYEYMLSKIPHGREYAKILQGVNVIHYKNFSIRVPGVRMSGEMSTSLGNGFSNLMIWMFLAERNGIKVKGVVEGDDGLFAQCGGDYILKTSDFKSVGFEAKLEVHKDLLTASFCGISMSEDLISLTDPRKVLLNFGWSHSPACGPSPRVRIQLLRAKALSLLYEHPRCPILSKLAMRVIQMTEGVRARYEDNWYERQLSAEATNYRGWAFSEYEKGISKLARTKFDELYNISEELQVELEDTLDSWRGGMLPDVFVGLYGDEYSDCRDYFSRFVVSYGVKIT